MLIVTFNPSLDRTVLIDRLLPGADMRARSARRVEGGKGVNLARALRALGAPSLCSLTLKDFFPAADIRQNVSVVDAAGRQTRFIEPGPRLAAGDWRQAERGVMARLKGVKVMALCGSLPLGFPPDIYARLTAAARRRGVMTFLDSSGMPLAKGVKARPWGVKPNRAEAEALLGIRIRSRRAVRKALQRLAGYGMTRVLLSLAEEGLAGFDGNEMLLACGPRRQGSTVGCGDAALAGFLTGHAAGASFADSLILAAAAGAANVGAQVPGGILRANVLALQRKIIMERI